METETKPPPATPAWARRRGHWWGIRSADRITGDNAACAAFNSSDSFDSAMQGARGGGKAGGGGGGGQVKVAVCGHKQVAVVTVTAAPSSLDVAVAWKLPELDDLVVEADWIRTALSSSSSTSVPDLALVYAHNLVELWPYMAAAPTRRVLATDRSLLYSAKLMPQLEASNFYIAAGTVFSEVREFDDHLMLFICKRLHWQHCENRVVLR